MIRFLAVVLAFALVGSTELVRAQETEASEPPPQTEPAPEAEPPSETEPAPQTEPAPAAAPAPEQPCPKGKRGGAIGGVVVGSVFWWLLPMSIPVLITQTKKLKSHNAAMRDQRCQYAPTR